MNRGILKLFKVIFILIISILFIGCNFFNPVENNSSQMIEKRSIKKEITSKPIIAIKINKVKSLTKAKHTVKKNNIVQPKVIVKKKAIISTKVKEIKNLSKTKPIIKKEAPKETKSIIKKNTTTKDKNDFIINDLPTDKQIAEPTDQTSFRQSTLLDKKNLNDFAFDLIKKGNTDKNTLLIVGGIQGDEPGGFMAASLMSTHYKITKGSVWIVPNLNFYSIIKRSRGPFGDMNRKFASLSKSDPEYNIIQRIKKYITDPNVKLILNLHDGSGFYRPMYIDRMHQPLRWGQTVVIDQEILHNVDKYNDTYTISQQVVNHVNKHLLKKEDIYRTKNTHTRFKRTHEEQEMAKTLTYYAVSNGKSAFGHETSKDLPIDQRVYYKLLAMEKFMDIMGIKYERKFKMNLKGINSALNDDINIVFNDTDITIPLKDIRNSQLFFPIKKNGIVKYLPSNPLLKIIKKGNVYTIYYGNRRLTRLEADYAEHLNFHTEVSFKIDGKTKKVKFGDTIDIKNNFSVIDEKKFRVNVIGYKHKSGIETGKTIDKTMFMRRYSVEKNGNMYRVEFYKKKKFAGMILVNYIK